MSMTGAPERMVVVTKNYPSVRDPHVGTFVHSLAGQFAQAGVDVTVIAPPTVFSFYRRSHWHSGVRRGREWSAQGAAPGILAVLQQGVARRLLNVPVDLGQLFQDRGKGGTPISSLPLRWSMPTSYSPPAGLRWSWPGVGGYRRWWHWEKGHCGTTKGTSMPHSLGKRSTSSPESYASPRKTGTTAWSGWAVPDERITLLPNAADTTRVYPRDRESMRYKFGLPAERPIVVFVGHFQNDKGPQRVMDAISHLPEVGAVFLGSGSQTPDGSQVLFAGKVPHAEIPEWLSAADLFILPTLVEASSNAIGEAMACGLPIVSSDIPSSGPWSGTQPQRWLTPTDEAVLGRAIEDLLGSPERRRQMSASGLERAPLLHPPAPCRLILDWLAGIASQKAEAAR